MTDSTGKEKADLVRVPPPGRYLQTNNGVMCLLCGAMVLSTPVHDVWHADYVTVEREALERIREPSPEVSTGRTEFLVVCGSPRSHGPHLWTWALGLPSRCPGAGGSDD